MNPAPSPTPVLVALLLGQLAYGLLAMTICIPSMQVWAAQFGAPQAQVQLTFSAYVLGYGGLQLLYGPLSDRLGRRRVLLAGLALAVLGSALAALAPNLTALAAARLLQGAGCAAGIVVGRAMVQDLFQGPERTKVMAWIGMAMGLCPPLATVLGGQVHAWLGWQANFVAMALLGAWLWGLAWRHLPRGVPPAQAAGGAAPTGLGAAYARLARERAFWRYALVLAMSTATFYAFLAGAPLVLGSLGVGPQRVGLFIMFVPLSYMAGSWATTQLAPRVGEARLIAAGQLVTLTGLALLLAAGLWGPRTPLAFSLPLMLLGLGHGLFVPAALAGTVGVVPALAGTAAAVAGVGQQFVGALGGWLVGLVPHDGSVNLALLMLVLAGTGALAQWRLR